MCGCVSLFRPPSLSTTFSLYVTRLKTHQEFPRRAQPSTCGSHVRVFGTRTALLRALSTGRPCTGLYQSTRAPHRRRATWSERKKKKTLLFALLWPRNGRQLSASQRTFLCPCAQSEGGQKRRERMAYERRTNKTKCQSVERTQTGTRAKGEEYAKMDAALGPPRGGEAGEKRSPWIRTSRDGTCCV